MIFVCGEITSLRWNISRAPGRFTQRHSEADKIFDVQNPGVIADGTG
jgi:hypothetical protein